MCVERGGGGEERSVRSEEAGLGLIHLTRFDKPFFFFWPSHLSLSDTLSSDLIRCSVYLTAGAGAGGGGGGTFFPPKGKEDEERSRLLEDG